MNKNIVPLCLQLCRFGIVGFSAALLNIGIVALLVQHIEFKPLLANFFGFIIALQLSYWGHRLWTFKNTSTSHSHAYVRFLLLQIINLILNEALFYFFLSLKIHYLLALIIVLAIMPSVTFVISKIWIFPAAVKETVVR